MPEVYMLTTIDNPFDPFDEFEDWYRYDSVEHDYNTCSMLARIATTSETFSEYEQLVQTNDAIDFILENDLTGKRIKVKEGQIKDLRSRKSLESKDSVNV